MADINDLEKLAELKKKGIISDAEFTQQKDAILKSNSNQVASGEQKERIVYILLGFFLGGFGVHNFYAGYTGKGVAQLLITLFLFWLVIPLLAVFVWVIIEIITVTKDANGVAFK
ncbi:MAG: NINE protein [Alphaproteobacteria bacterium]|nr:NINE protein [Alphaproteobacteria bacterium]